MKIKKIVLFTLMILLTISLMGCPDKINRPPRFVQFVDGEMININSVTYYHVRGTEFHPDDMIEDLINLQNIKAIDFDQTKIAIGKQRDYEDISDDIIVTTFYEIWLDGDDANFDGVVDEADEEFYGRLKTDEDGNYVIDQGKLFLIRISAVGSEFTFTMRITDSEGARAEITGVIIIIAPEA